jgi:hypothetical protein
MHHPHHDTATLQDLYAEKWPDDSELPIYFDVSVDYGPDGFTAADVRAINASLHNNGRDYPFDERHAQRMLEHWLSVPGNLQVVGRALEGQIERENEAAPDPEYQRAVANGRLILRNGRDVS